MKIEDKISEYINNDCWKKSFMLSGAWGTGKTTAMRDFIINYHNRNKENTKFTHYCIVNGYEIKNEFDLKKYIIKNSKDLKTNQIDPLITGVLKRGLNTLTNLPQSIKNLEKPSKKIFNNFFKSYTQIPVNAPEIAYDFLKNNIEFIYEVDILSKCIVIIDEIDRKQDYNLGVIFSKMIDLLENYKMKIIFIINKDVVVNENETKILNDWYEKIFDFEITMEDEKRKITPPITSSSAFKKYFQRNKKHFNNYRSYEKYKNFEKVIDQKLSYLNSSNDGKSIINDFKESLFYNIFYKDNPNSFEQGLHDEKGSEKASYIYLGYTKTEIPEFLKLNYTPALEKIKEEMTHYQGNLGDINKAANKYLNSHYMCHRIDNGGLKNPLKFILDEIINKYKDFLCVDFSTKEIYQLTFWVKSSMRLGITEKDKNYLFELIKDKIKNMHNESILKYKSQILNNEIPKYNEMINKYQEIFNEENEFIEIITLYINDIINKLKEQVLINMSILDDDFLLSYYMRNSEETLEILIDDSKDFIDDLRRLKELDISNYKKMRTNYLQKYPNENSRPIKDWMFEIIDGKHENKIVSETKNIIKSLNIDEAYKYKMFEILKKYNKFDNINKNNIFNDFKEVILETSNNNPDIILEFLPLLTYLGK